MTAQKRLKVNRERRTEEKRVTTSESTKQFVSSLCVIDESTEDGCNTNSELYYSVSVCNTNI